MPFPDIDLRDAPSSLLTSGKFTSELVGAMIKIMDKISGERSFIVDGLGNTHHLGDIDVDGRHLLEVSLEGEIEVSPPHKPGEIDRGSSYTRVNFRSSLRFRVGPGGQRGDSSTKSDAGDTNPR